MMPYDHPSNPWLQQYPAVALDCRLSSDRALYDALLAHSAYNLSELRGKDHKMLYQATLHYDRAISNLLRRMHSGDLSFRTTFAAVLTLVLVEVYSGSSSKWRQHLQGASKLLRAAEGEVQDLYHMQTSVQSMYIMHIVSQTSNQSRVGFHEALRQSNLTADTPAFGFTIGASEEVLNCILRITEFSHAIAEGESISKMMRCLATISELLDHQHVDCRNTDGVNVDTLQRFAFVLATKIYLQRAIFNAPPKSVQPLVSTTLQSVIKFCEKDSRNNFSIWPAFIAAVEAYTEQDLKEAEMWLCWSTTFGMGNRILIADVVREVWRRREKESQRTQNDKGLICVDWREVMRDLGHDVLLI